MKFQIPQTNNTLISQCEKHKHYQVKDLLLTKLTWEWDKIFYKKDINITEPSN